MGRRKTSLNIPGEGGRLKPSSVYLDPINGNAATEDRGIDYLWNTGAFMAARKKLLRGERDFGPCAGCDAVSYRPGLLPDAKGQVTLPALNAVDHHAIAEALAGDPYTIPVFRPWEKT